MTTKTTEQKINEMYHAVVGNEALGQPGLVPQMKVMDARVSKLEDDKKSNKWFRRGVMFGGGAVVSPYAKAFILKAMAFFGGAAPFFVVILFI